VYSPDQTLDSTTADRREAFKKGYIGQVEYINQQIKEIIDLILTKNSEPPIIIIQGDHGSRITLNWQNPEQTNWGETYSILNAIYLPKIQKDSVLYSSISPVNTFRMVFNQYFGRDLEYLDDRSVFYNQNHSSEIKDVTHKLP